MLLLALLFAGSLRLAWRAQARDALQGRLDACAVRLAVDRERLLEKLRALNGPLRASVKAVVAARAAISAGAAGAIAAERAALAANRTIAGAQEALLLAAGAREAGRLACAAGTFSSSPAACLAAPPALLAAIREAGPFPDVRGPLRARGAEAALARVRCAGTGGVQTQLAVNGDPSLARPGFRDEYER